jgi:hypothetical protein
MVKNLRFTTVAKVWLIVVVSVAPVESVTEMGTAWDRLLSPE